MQEYCIKTSSNICFGYLLESPQWGDSNKYPKYNVLWGSKHKTRHFLHTCIILSIRDSLQQQIHFIGNIFWNKCYRCIEGSLYSVQNHNWRRLNILACFKPLFAREQLSGLAVCYPSHKSPAEKGSTLKGKTGLLLKRSLLYFWVDPFFRREAKQSCQSCLH